VFLRSDAAIRDEIVDDVFHRVLWIVPAEGSVEVRDGVVTLAGELEQKGLVEVAVRLARGVDGVVSVVNRLRYRIDESTIHIDDPLLGRP
jgi:osmotically-inducible protein OsmY